MDGADCEHLVIASTVTPRILYLHFPRFLFAPAPPLRRYPLQKCPLHSIPLRHHPRWPNGTVYISRRLRLHSTGAIVARLMEEVENMSKGTRKEASVSLSTVNSDPLTPLHCIVGTKDTRNGDSMDADRHWTHGLVRGWMLASSDDQSPGRRNDTVEKQQEVKVRPSRSAPGQEGVFVQRLVSHLRGSLMAFGQCTGLNNRRPLRSRFQAYKHAAAASDVDEVVFSSDDYMKLQKECRILKEQREGCTQILALKNEVQS